MTQTDLLRLIADHRGMISRVETARFTGVPSADLGMLLTKLRTQHLVRSYIGKCWGITVRGLIAAGREDAAVVGYAEPAGQPATPENRKKVFERRQHGKAR
jgi:uncharacterized protein YjhX (UPF0386 family)